MFVLGSMRDIGNSKDVTHTEPSPAAISPPAPGTPTSMVATTSFVFGSIRETLPSPWLRVHTPPSPTARNRGAGPTGMVATIA